MFGGEGGDVVDGVIEGHRDQPVFEVDRAVGLVGQPQVDIANTVGELLVEILGLRFTPAGRNRLDDKVLQEAGKLSESAELVLTGQRPR